MENKGGESKAGEGWRLNYSLPTALRGCAAAVLALPCGENFSLGETGRVW